MADGRHGSASTNTPLPRKLGIREGSKVAVINAPEGLEDELAPLPAGVDLRAGARGRFDIILFFVRRRAELARRFLPLARAIDPSGGLWIAWPKRSSRVETDIDQSVVMDIGLAEGLVDNKVCAIDETWSALRFVVRKENRAAWPPAAPKRADGA